MVALDKKEKIVHTPEHVLAREFQLRREMLLNKNPVHMDEYSEIVEREQRPHRRSMGNVKVDFPVYGLSDEELISVGINDRHLLIKVRSIHLSPNPSSLKKELAHGKSVRSTKRQEIEPTSNVDRFWVQRYAIFERFDEGIKLD